MLAAGASIRRRRFPAIAEAMESGEPYVIDVAIDREAYPPVTNFDAHMERSL